MNEFLPEMIPELQKWNGGTGIDLAAFVHVIGRFDHAIAYAHFFWPTFRVHDECVLLAEPDAAVYEEWLNKFDGRRASVEAMLNHVHVYDAFHAHGPGSLLFSLASAYGLYLHKVADVCDRP